MADSEPVFVEPSALPASESVVGGTGGSDRVHEASSFPAAAVRPGSALRYIRHNPGGVAELGSLWLQLALTDLRLKLLPWRLNRSFVFPADGSSRSGSNPASGQKTVAFHDSSGGHILTEAERTEIQRLTLQVARAARFHALFTMSCLRRSLVLRSRLARAGIPSRLVFGAGKRAGGSFRSFKGHAWLDVCGMAVDSYGIGGRRSAFSTPGSRSPSVDGG